MNSLSMRTSNINLMRNTCNVGETLMTGDVKHVVRFYSQRLSMPIIEDFMKDNPCIQVSLKEQTMWLAQNVTKFISRFLVSNDIQWCTSIKFYQLIQSIYRGGRFCCVCIRLCESAAGVMSHLRGHQRRNINGSSLRLWMVCTRFAIAIYIYIYIYIYCDMTHTCVFLVDLFEG